MESVDLNNANLTIKLDYSLKFRYARVPQYKQRMECVRSSRTINSFVAVATANALNFESSVATG